MKKWPERYEIVTARGPVRVEVRLSLRAKRMRLRVVKGRLELVVPKRASRAVAEEFLRAAGRWVEIQADKLARLEADVRRDRVWWKGEELAVCLGDEEGKVVFGDGFVEVGAADLEVARGILLRFMRREARRVFEERLAFFEKEMGGVLQFWRVGDMSSRWGSCSGRGTVSLNWRLVMAPPEVLDYIVIHELAHLREMNHSSRFWAVVEAFCPGYREREKWLKEYGAVLMCCLG